MEVEFDPHASERMALRGASEGEVRETISRGERFPAKHGRHCFRRRFAGPFVWQGRRFSSKEVEAYAVLEEKKIIVITVIVRYLQEHTP